MANPIPTLSVVSYKGSGNVTVHKLLNGITIDPIQDGNDVLTGTLEVPSGSFENVAPNRLIEAFGKRFLVHGHRIYERDQGGAGNWGEVTGLAQSDTLEVHSGIHLLHPNGVPTLAVLMSGTVAHGNVLSLMSSTDGVSWSHVNLGQSINAGGGIGHSVVFRDSICWMVGNINIPVAIHDLKLNTTIYPVALNFANAGTSSATLLVHQNNLFLLGESTTGFNPYLYRLDGTSWTQVITGFPVSSGNNSTGECHTMWSDGDDIVCLIGNIGITQAARVSDVLLGGSPSILDITSATTLDAGQAGAYSFTASHPDPRTSERTVYFWHRVGNHNVGSFKFYRWNYRQITHGAVTNGPFVVNEVVTQSVSGATGVVTSVGAGSLDLTDVQGTFDNTNTLTGGDSGATAAATSLLVDQQPTLLGVGPSAVNFSILNDHSGGLTRTPIKGSARPGWDGQPVEVLGGRTKWFFRCYGTGPAIDLGMFFSPVEEAPDISATLINGSLAVESGSPATTPTITNGTTIDNVTPDGGVALYSFEHDADTDNIASGQGYSALLDIV